MGPGGVVRQRRRIAVAVLMTLWGVAIGARLVHLQIVQAAELSARAEEQQQRVLEISPRRGPIYDRNGNPLAISIEVDSLAADPSAVEDRPATAAFLAEVLDLPSSQLEERLNPDRRFVWLKRKITAAQSEAIRGASIPGLQLLEEPKRFYPNRELAAHVLGFVNIDNDGGSGIEYQYNDIIRGTPGQVVVRTDARGQSFQGVEQAPTIGASLTLTLDRNIQFFVEREIDRTIQETQAVGMSVVVMDPTNGAVLAMANYPEFNPNEYGQYPQRSWSNRAIAHAFEPGSTFKILTAGAALEEGLTHLEEVVDGQNGSIELYGHRINDHQPFGLITVREVMQYSSDVGIIKLGLRLGDARFADYIDRFGFGRRTGIDLPGEHVGLTKPASDWSSVSVGAISMGQEIGATALQVLNLVSVVANGGTLYRPFLTQGVTDPVSGTTSEAEPLGERVLARSTVRLLQEALEAVVVDGTGSAAAIPGYTSAGKTGTAQKIDPATGRYSPTAHVASFAGYAPARNPVVSVVVVIDEPQGAAYHGGEVAAPVFRRVAEQVLRYRAVAPDVPENLPLYADLATEPAAVVRPIALESVSEPTVRSEPAVRPEPTMRVGDDSGVRVRVPDFLGRSLRQVTGDCLTLDLECVSVGSGVAVDQWPGPGDLARPGSAVQISFSTARGGRVSTN